MMRISIDGIGPFSKIVVHDRWFSILLFAVLLLGCRSLPSEQSPVVDETVDPTAPDAFYSDAEIAIPALIEAERFGSIERDLLALGLLWREDARIIDGRATIRVEDDYIWSGKTAILDRYTVAVFPNPPPPIAKPLQLEILVEGENARVIHGVDTWQFVRTEGRWWFDELAYQRP